MSDSTRMPFIAELCIVAHNCNVLWLVNISSLLYISSLVVCLLCWNGTVAHADVSGMWIWLLLLLQSSWVAHFLATPDAFCFLAQHQQQNLYGRHRQLHLSFWIWVELDHFSISVFLTNATFKHFILLKCGHVKHCLHINCSECIWWPGSTWTCWGSLQCYPRPLADLATLLLMEGKGREDWEERVLSVPDSESFRSPCDTDLSLSLDFVRPRLHWDM